MMMLTEIYDRLDGMSSGEINTWRSQLKGKVSKLNIKMAERNKYLKSLGKTAAQRKADPEYASLLTMLEDYSHMLNVIKDYRREHAAQLEIERTNAELEIRRMRREDAMREAETQDALIAKAREIEKIRPAAPRIYFGSEFRKCTTSERRLVSMMAREIGLERYQQLRKIAFWDEKMKRRAES